ncbi:hypothetical protein AGMMS49983_04290 [Clostridia bacterium]|nr:hypothetical protein AGMMS49983_04290 [Clostridia bacterium]
MYNNFPKIRAALLAWLFTAVSVVLLSPTPALAAENVPAPAAGAASAVSAAAEDSQRISMEVRYTESEKAVIPEVISQFGRDYRLVYTGDPVPEGSLPETRTYSYRISGLLTADQIAEVRGLGDLKLTPVTGSRTVQVERDEVLTGLPTNDIDDLPLYKRYEETSATSPGATVSGELKLAEAAFEVAGKDPYGLPNNYTAYTVYRGSETTTYTAYYSGEATYKRTVTEGGDPTYVVVATYAPSVLVEIEEPVPLGAPPIEEPSGAAEDLVPASIGGGSNPLAAFWDSRSVSEKIVLLTGIAVVIAAILFLLLFLKRRRKTPPASPTTRKTSALYT